MIATSTIKKRPLEASIDLFEARPHKRHRVDSAKFSLISDPTRPQRSFPQFASLPTELQDLIFEQAVVADRPILPHLPNKPIHHVVFEVRNSLQQSSDEAYSEALELREATRARDMAALGLAICRVRLEASKSLRLCLYSATRFLRVRRGGWRCSDGLSCLVLSGRRV